MSRGTGKRIAVVGAGVAGLSAARDLLGLGHEVHVFDKGRAAGGRISSRRTERGAFDHGAPAFRAKSPAFRAVVGDLISRGAAGIWRPNTLKLDRKGGRLHTGDELFIGIPQMDAVARELAAGLRLDCSTAVREIEFEKEGFQTCYRLVLARHGIDRSIRKGPFDALVLTLPPMQAAALVDSETTLSQQLLARRMMAQWVVLVDFPSRPELDFDRAMFADLPIAQAVDESSKPGRADSTLWTLHADAEWTARNLEAEPESIARKLFAAFSEAFPGRVPPAGRMIAHRWRYARADPGNAPWEAVPGPLQFAGDWCGDGRVEGAFLTGRRAAERVVEHFNGTAPNFEGRMEGGNR